ncbi:hypothetical protein B0I35DRAFT_156339 [Stachybotrys elegans]|uniref:Uncharacterized protein n=1 Tax=Stachybotrys elegans TaxID=80388 RepID=A0A8K0SH14_9HYPO|nr:hypothetical protein B0I35DRAFT_156339 [Stachybotrys elegans]
MSHRTAESHPRPGLVLEMSPPPNTRAMTTTTPSLPSMDSAPTSNMSRISPKPPRLANKLSRCIMDFVELLCILLLFALVILFVETTRAAERRSDEGLPLSPLLRINGSTTIAIVQACQVLLLALTGLSLDATFERVQYSIMQSPRGLNYICYLALSPATGYLGTLRFVFARPLASVPLSARLWGFFKICLKGGIWLSGIVLFSK